MVKLPAMATAVRGHRLGAARAQLEVAVILVGHGLIRTVVVDRARRPERVGRVVGRERVRATDPERGAVRDGGLPPTADRFMVNDDRSSVPAVTVRLPLVSV